MLDRLTREVPAWKKFQDLWRLAADLSLLPAPNGDPTTFVKVPWLLLESTAAGGLRVSGRSVRPLTRVLFDLVLLTLFVISFFKRVNVCVCFF